MNILITGSNGFIGGNLYKYLKKIQPQGVIIAAAKVGGIKANNDLKANFIFRLKKRAQEISLEPKLNYKLIILLHSVVKFFIS